jgi:serine protease Do
MAVLTPIYSPSGGSVGIAFDIPASTVASVIPQLQKNGQVSRGWLGVQIQPVTGEIAESLGLKRTPDVRFRRDPATRALSPISAEGEL